MFTAVDWTFDQVNELIAYDPLTGKFTWRKNVGRRIKAGAEAGTSRKSANRSSDPIKSMGYRYICMFKSQTPAARVAWLLSYGVWPTRSIQFKDGNLDNLKIENLKEPAHEVIKIVGEDGKTKYRMPKEQFRKYNLKRYYGLSMQTYELMLAAQDGKCAICRGNETYQPRGYVGPKALSVDHNHETGEIRGLLCSNCNYMVGHCKENREVLLAGVAYLDKYNGTAKAAPTLTLVPTDSTEDHA